MADEVDITTDREELNIANAIRAARQSKGPGAFGKCHWCSEPLAGSARWCDENCRDDWQRDFTMRKKAGL